MNDAAKRQQTKRTAKVKPVVPAPRSHAIPGSERDEVVTLLVRMYRRWLEQQQEDGAA